MAIAIHRPAGPDDVEGLLALIRAYYAFDHLVFREERMRDGLRRFLADPSLGRAFFVEVGGERAGYVLFTFGFDLEFGGKLALVTDLFLEPAFRRQGHGLATLRFVESLAPQLGFHALELQVERGNLPAQALYQAFGFTALERIPLSKELGAPP